METIQFWMCDACKQPIRRPEDGCVEWLMVHGGQTDQATGLRLVHHDTACQYDLRAERTLHRATVCSRGLKDLLGPDGLMMFLCLLSNGELPKDEVLELAKRLHIPGYEQARPHFQAAIRAGVFEPSTPTGYYWQEDIAATLAYLQKNPRPPQS